MRMCQVLLVLFVAAVAINDAVSASTADEWSKLTSRGLDQEAGTHIDGDRMLRARDESADVTGEERGFVSTNLAEYSTKFAKWIWGWIKSLRSPWAFKAHWKARARHNRLSEIDANFVVRDFSSEQLYEKRYHPNEVAESVTYGSNNFVEENIPNDIKKRLREYAKYYADRKTEEHLAAIKFIYNV